MQVSDGGLRAPERSGVSLPVDLHRRIRRVGPVQAHVPGEEILEARTQRIREWRRRIGSRIKMVPIVHDGLPASRRDDGIAGIESLGWPGRETLIRLIDPVAEHHGARREQRRKLGVEGLGQDLLLELLEPHAIGLIAVDPTEGGKIRQVLDELRDRAGVQRFLVDQLAREGAGREGGEQQGGSSHESQTPPASSTGHEFSSSSVNVCAPLLDEIGCQAAHKSQRISAKGASSQVSFGMPRGEV